MRALPDLERKQGETDFEYHKRLIYGKLVDKTLSDFDYAELSPFVYGREYSTDVARRMMYGSRNTLQLLEKNQIDTNSDVLEEINQKLIELKKERQKISDERTAYNKHIREQARDEELLDILSKSIKKQKLPYLTPIQACFKQRSDNDLLVSLNDIHYGAVVDNYWCKYDSSICRDMFDKYLHDIVRIAKTHDSENCIVWCNGDEISGNIHKTISVTNKENIIEQVVGVSELIAEFLAMLSEHFVNVRFVSVSGNHSRIESKNDALMQERLDDLVEWYLKARFQNFDNIQIGYGDKIDCSMYLMDIRGQTYCGVHGDYDVSKSNIQTLRQMAKRPIYAVLMGHLHHNKIETDDGLKIIMAGSFLGMDSYCVSKRIFAKPEQLVCVCDNNGIVCSYDIQLSK